MDASIIICVKNGGAHLKKQLDAVANQITEYSHEIVIVNNGSTDNTDQVLKDWERSSPVSVPVKIFSQPDLKGRMVLAGGRIESYDSKGNYVPSLFPRGLIGTSYLPHVGNCNCAINRKLFFEIGGYDESLPRYGFEDVDFSWRVQEAGYPIEYIDDALIRFRMSDSKTSLKKKFLLGKGRVIMARRYPQYDGASYSLGYCVKKIAVITSYIFKRLAREQTLNRRELSMLVAAVGNLYGSLYYAGNNKKPAPKLINS